MTSWGFSTAPPPRSYITIFAQNGAASTPCAFREVHRNVKSSSKWSCSLSRTHLHLHRAYLHQVVAVFAPFCFPRRSCAQVQHIVTETRDKIMQYKSKMVDEADLRRRLASLEESVELHEHMKRQVWYSAPPLKSPVCKIWLK